MSTAVCLGAPLQMGVLECTWMVWESAAPVLWGRAVMAHCWALELILMFLEQSAVHLQCL